MREEHELVRIADRERPQHHAVDERENRRIRADAEGERRDGGRGDAARLQHHSQRIPNVQRQFVIEAHATCLATVLLHARDRPKLEPRATQGRFSRQAGALKILGIRLEMKSHLVVHLAFEACAASQRAKQGAKPGPHLRAS